MEKYMPSIRYLVLSLVLCLVAGCASDPVGPLILKFKPTAVDAAGYSLNAAESAYEDANVKLTVRQVGKGEVEGTNALLEELTKRGYILIQLDIINKSKHKMMYNPTYSTLTNNVMDYMKPLDFTDLYDIVMSTESLEPALRELKGRLYDLNVTLYPNARISKALLFRPMEKGVGTAALTIKELYIGTGVMTASFPFDLEKEE